MPLDVLDELIKQAGGASAVGGPDGLLKQLTAALVNRALEVEMAEHLGYERGDEPDDGESNRRNGHREKTVRTERGEMAIEVPRDREGTFEPKIVPKHRRGFDGFDDKILSMYARGMTTREIQGDSPYAVGMSPTSIPTAPSTSAYGICVRT